MADPLEGRERARQEFEDFLVEEKKQFRDAVEKARAGNGYWIETFQFSWHAFQAGRRSLEQERDELLNHALQCMNRNCQRCNAAMKERDLVHKGDS